MPLGPTPRAGELANAKSAVATSERRPRRNAARWKRMNLGNAENPTGARRTVHESSQTQEFPGSFRGILRASEMTGSVSQPDDIRAGFQKFQGAAAHDLKEPANRFGGHLDFPLEGLDRIAVMLGERPRWGGR